MWSPVLDPADGPLYLALAHAIAEAIASGTLAPGQRLPTQRALAERLGIALTTVTRGYGEAERRGLVRGEVGRGTYVSATVPEWASVAEGGPVDLRPNTMLPTPLMSELQGSMAAIVGESGRLDLFDYGPHAGAYRHREAGAAWLGRVGMAASVDEVVVTSGGQHAMAVALSVVARPGDVVLVEEVTYAGMKSLAEFLDLRLGAVPLDEEGIQPDALRGACLRHGPVALYCMPTLQNPTSAVMSEERRREVAEVVNAAGLALVEDDSYGYLLPEPPRLSALCDRSFYIAGTSKSLLPSLRVGYLRAPAEAIDRVEAKVAATTYVASPLLAEVAARWISDGTAERVIAWKRNEARARQELTAQILGGRGYRAHGSSPHGWLSLPEPWSARDFARQAAEHGVLVTPARVFAVARDQVPHAVRICVGPARSREALERGLETLARILDAGPEPLKVVI
jgi:DNA-binding transcriptional MocR family regulator